MYKILDLAEVFALGEEFNALHILSVVFVIGGVVAVFMFGIRSDSQQFPKAVISKSVNVIKKKKRTEVTSKEVIHKSSSTAGTKSKEKNKSLLIQKKPKTDEVPLKKVSSNIANKNVKTVSPNTNQKDKKIKVKSTVNEINDNEGEWRMVVTKKPKKTTTDSLAVDVQKKQTTTKQKEDKDDKKNKTNKDVPVAEPKSTYPKIEDVIAAMSSQTGNQPSIPIPEVNTENQELGDAEWTTRPNKKTKKRALRE